MKPAKLVKNQTEARRPSQKIIDRERRQQDAVVVALRRMLAEGSDADETVLFGAA